jgi:hypothetical protein
MANVSLTPSGPPETVLPVETPETQRLMNEISIAQSLDRAKLLQLISMSPRSPGVWALYGQHGTDTLESYAAYRVGYHRGLDLLRANGWRGSGFVRWQHASNRGFLLCLLGLQLSAEKIGENDEAERCRLFLLQLDPSGVPQDIQNSQTHLRQ